MLASHHAVTVGAACSAKRTLTKEKKHLAFTMHIPQLAHEKGHYNLNRSHGDSKENLFVT